MLHGSTDSSRLKEEQAEFNSTSSPNMSALAIAEEVAPVAGEYHAYPQFIDHLRLLCTQEVPPTDDELEAIREKAALLAAETTTSAADRDHLQALIEVLGKDETEPQGFALLCGRLSDSGEGKMTAPMIRDIALRDRVIVALDYRDPSQARALVKQCESHIGFYKVGLELFMADWFYTVDWLIERGHQVMLDLKYHDIPNTVAGAVTQAARHRIRFLHRPCPRYPDRRRGSGIEQH